MPRNVCLQSLSLYGLYSLLLHTQPGGGGLLYDVGREGADTPGLGGANQAQDDEPGRRSGSAGPESGEQEVWSPLSRIYRTERQSA